VKNVIDISGKSSGDRKAEQAVVEGLRALLVANFDYDVAE
jgi:hypothetical protein